MPNSEEELRRIAGEIRACGLLTRQKHYKYILKTLGFEVTSDFDRILIADSQYGLQYWASRLLKERDKQDFRTLAFWHDRLEECLDLLERMKSHGRFIYSFVPNEIRKLSAYLLFVSVFGIIVPLLTFSASSLLGTWKITLSALSFVGFLSFFSVPRTTAIVGAVNIHSKATVSRRNDDLLVRTLLDLLHLVL